MVIRILLPAGRTWDAAVGGCGGGLLHAVTQRYRL